MKYGKEFSIEFIETPIQLSIPKQIKFNDIEFEIVDKKINELLVKRIIELVTEQNNDDEYIPYIFIRPKKNGKYRVILNLKHLNKFVKYHHFKIETLGAAIN